jgi:Tol biopolymer transport system component
MHLRPGEQFPIDTGLPVVVAISPGGDRIVYAARDSSGDRLYLRRRDDFEASPIPGTEGAIGPFFSPDGQWIGFASGGLLRAVPIAGGAPRTFAEAPNLEGASWGPDDTIVYIPQWRDRLFKVSATGGKPEPLTGGDEFVKSAHLLPGGRAALLSLVRGADQVLESLDIATGRRLPLVEGSNPFYVPTGHVVFARGTTLWTVPFDAARLMATGDAVRLFDGVRNDGNDAHFAAAGDGTLVYVPEASTISRLVWFDRQGHPRPLDSERRQYAHPRVSPDGTRVVLMVRRDQVSWDLWVYDVARGTRARLSASGRTSRPIWSADGSRITFQKEGDLYSVPADDSSSPELVLKRDDQRSSLYPLSWSRDGRLLAYSHPLPATNRDVWVLPVGKTPIPFLTTPRDERAAMFSPDGRWIVYAAKETGREEQIYVQPFPGPGGRIVVSPDSGIEPVWSATGREIFYRSVDGTRMLSVEVRTAPSLSVGPPRVLFAGRFVDSGGSYWSNYDVSRDGQQFLMLEADESSTPRINVVVNEAAALK